MSGSALLDAIRDTTGKDGRPVPGIGAASVLDEDPGPATGRDYLEKKWDQQAREVAKRDLRGFFNEETSRELGISPRRVGLLRKRKAYRVFMDTAQKGAELQKKSEQDDIKGSRSRARRAVMSRVRMLCARVEADEALSDREWKFLIKHLEYEDGRAGEGVVKRSQQDVVVTREQQQLRQVAADHYQQYLERSGKAPLQIDMARNTVVTQVESEVEEAVVVS